MKRFDCLAFILLLSLVGCSRPSSPIDLKLDSSISGRSLSYPRSQEFTLQLDLHADGGYQWAYSINDTNVVRIDSTSYTPKSGNWNQLGGVTIETFFFRTMQTGQSVITLIERRPWEPNVPALDSLTFTVVVTH